LLPENLRLSRISAKNGLLETKPVYGTGSLNRNVVSFRRLPASGRSFGGPSLAALRCPVAEALDVCYRRDLPFDALLDKGRKVPIQVIPSGAPIAPNRPAR
jgi:hypothetical protein